MEHFVTVNLNTWRMGDILVADPVSILLSFSVQILHDELSSMKRWVSTHVSDHSGFHYRQFLMKALVAELSRATDAPCGPSQDPHHAHWPNGDGLDTPAAEESRAASVPQLFDKELELCTDLIETYPGHETLWCHRRVPV